MYKLFLSLSTVSLEFKSKTFQAVCVSQHIYMCVCARAYAYVCIFEYLSWGKISKGIWVISVENRYMVAGREGALEKEIKKAQSIKKKKQSGTEMCMLNIKIGEDEKSHFLRTSDNMEENQLHQLGIFNSCEKFR